MAKDSDERPVKKVTIEVYADKLHSAFVSQTRIRYFAQTQDTIPSEWISEFFSYLKQRPKVNRKELMEMLNHFTDDTVEYFKRQKDKDYYNSSFKEIVSVIYNYMYADHVIERKSKKECLRYIYQNVSTRSDKLLVAKRRYTHYKKCVIAGYIASKYGLVPTQAEHDDDAYNQLLFDRLKRYGK